MKKVHIAKYGFNTVKKLKSGSWSFYAHQPCLYVASKKDAAQLTARLVENLRNDGWTVEATNEGVKLNPTFNKWSSTWCRVRAKRGSTIVVNDRLPRL